MSWRFALLLIKANVVIWTMVLLQSVLGAGL